MNIKGEGKRSVRRSSFYTFDVSLKFPLLTTRNRLSYSLFYKIDRKMLHKKNYLSGYSVMYQEGYRTVLIERNYLNVPERVIEYNSKTLEVRMLLGKYYDYIYEKTIYEFIKVDSNLDKLCFVKTIYSLKSEDKILLNYLRQYITKEIETPSLVLSLDKETYNQNIDRMLKSQKPIEYCINMKLQG